MRSLLCVVFLFSIAKTFAQTNPVFEKGLIVTKQNDSIKCFVHTETEYGARIFYKTEMDSKETSIRKKDVKVISLPHIYLQNIQVRKRELLMTVLVEGKARLYGHVATGASRRRAFLGVETIAPPAELLVYVVKKGSVYTEVTRERYRDVLSAILYDCPGLVQILRSKERAFAYEDLDRAVVMYNACK